MAAIKALKFRAVSVEVTDEEIQAQIDNLLNSYPDVKTVEGKTTIEEGDIVNIDFVGKLDGEPFEGGSSGEGGTNLEIGSGSFIDGFEDGLIGKTTGSTVELPLTFPEEYSLNPDLAGKDVVFEVTIHDIVEYVTPEWNDEFVAEEYRVCFCRRICGGRARADEEAEGRKRQGRKRIQRNGSDYC